MAKRQGPARWEAMRLSVRNVSVLGYAGLPALAAGGAVLWTVTVLGAAYTGYWDDTPRSTSEFNPLVMILLMLAWTMGLLATTYFVFDNLFEYLYDRVGNGSILGAVLGSVVGLAFGVMVAAIGLAIMAFYVGMIVVTGAVLFLMIGAAAAAIKD